MGDEKSVRDYIAKVNKNYKNEMVKVGGKFSALNVPRFSSGILNLDVALGGGWPFSRVGLIAGEESTGKTLIATKAAAEIKKYDHKTKKLISSFPEDQQPKCIPGRALIVDVEGAFDLDWAEDNGFDSDYHLVARPEFAEQTVDIVTEAIEGDIFSLIVIDSIAAMIPYKELEDSAEDWQIGLAARINNKAFRKWGATLNKLSQVGKLGPFVLCLNQLRIDIGVKFGDPRVLPGGRQQKFSASVTLFTKSGKYEDTETKELAEVELSGLVKKNKTHIPRQNYKFKLFLKNTEEGKRGDVDNPEQLLYQAKKFKLLVKKEGKYFLGDKSFATEIAFKNRVRTVPELRELVWRSILSAATK